MPAESLRTAQRYGPEDRTVYSHHREQIKDKQFDECFRFLSRFFFNLLEAS
jgi:hypothetical protein